MALTFHEDNALYDFVVRNGNGIKGLVDSGIEKVPERYVQPPQERIDKLKYRLHEHQPIDLLELDGPNRDQVAEQIVKAVENIGFFQVVNHGVPLELLESLKEAAHRFFGQPSEKKAIYCKGVSPSRLVTYGTSFAPEKEKVLEWKDSLSMIYTNDAEAHQVWPRECKDEALEYLKTSAKMARTIVQVLMEKLGIKADDPMINDLLGPRAVNMNFYPPCPNPDLTVGVGRHSDSGMLTILLQDNIGGLYVKLEENIDGAKKGEWVEIPPIPGALVINVGDAFQILSNGRYKSAEHRARTTSTQSRVSTPIFIVPKITETIGPLKQVVDSNDGVAHYRPVIFGEYLKSYFGNAHDGKKSLDFARIN